MKFSECAKKDLATSLIGLDDEHTITEIEELSSGFQLISSPGIRFLHDVSHSIYFLEKARVNGMWLEFADGTIVE